MKKGFTLVEMLVAVGIIAVLTGVSMASFNKMMKSADKARAQELVSQVATALTAIYEADGMWPKRIREAGEKGGVLDKDTAFVLGKRGYLSLSVKRDESGNATELSGKDRFGILTPWADKLVSSKGSSASLGTLVGGSSTVSDHILHFAVDTDGDGCILGADVGGESVNIRATVAVWSIGKGGGNSGQPWPYKTGLKKDDVYSWTKGQTQAVQ